MKKEKFLEFVKEINEKDDAIRHALKAMGKLEPPIVGAFSYIPFRHEKDLYDFFTALKEYWSQYSFRKNGEPTLLDVGAGTGRIVVLAKFMGIKAKGIELNSDCVFAGRKAFGLSEEELIVKNAFDLDSGFLKEFNTIYTYMPIRDGALMGKLHLHLYSASQYGTILAEMLPQYYPIDRMERCSNPMFNKLHGAYLRVETDSN